MEIYTLSCIIFIGPFKLQTDPKENEEHYSEQKNKTKTNNNSMGGSVTWWEEKNLWVQLYLLCYSLALVPKAISLSHHY